MQPKTVAILSSTVISVVGIVAVLLLAQSALAAGKNGAILMSAFAIIGVAVGGGTVYNSKKLKDIISRVPNLEGKVKNGRRKD